MSQSGFGLHIITEHRNRKLSLEKLDYIGMTYVYILRSLTSQNQLYVGVSDNLPQRLNDHNQGKCRHTYKFKPWRLIYTEEFVLRADAFKREQQLKCWSRGKKEALIAGDRSMLKYLSRRRKF
jgi:predicted GIY-YIG superfamily endonuclease